MQKGNFIMIKTFIIENGQKPTKEQLMELKPEDLEEKEG